MIFEMIMLLLFDFLLKIFFLFWFNVVKYFCIYVN